VLRHRLVLNFNAEADGVTADEIIRRLGELIPEHAQPPAPLAKMFRG
jgi:hypothetical protein